MKSRFAGGVKRIEDYLVRDKLRDHIHLQENGTTGIVFVKDSLSVYRCPKTFKKAIERFLEGVARSKACDDYGIPEQSFEGFLLVLLEKSKYAPTVPVKSSEPRILERLVMNVSNDCNLRCRYCYAGGGNYGLQKSYMEKKTAIRVLDRFFELFDRVGTIQFFGGEPMLNASLIDFICHDLQRRLKEGRLKEIPKLAAVTNGTILTNDIQTLLTENGISVTVSLDGPRDINDFLRGQGSFDRTVDFVNMLDRNGIRYGFEATYTARHIEAGLSLASLMDFFAGTFSRREMHIPDVAVPEGHALALGNDAAKEAYRNAVEYSMENLIDKRLPCLSFASRLMNAFADREPIVNYCPAGLGTIAVDCAGHAYPCFMFIGMEEFFLGNVFDDEFPVRRRVKKVFQRMAAENKDNDENCTRCWVKPLCFGCTGGDFVKTGGTFKKTNCDIMKAMAEGFLSKVVQFPDQETHGPTEVFGGSSGGERTSVTC